MNTWKNLFTNTILTKAKKSKAEIKDVKHTSRTISATIKSNREFKVELVVENGVLFDTSCSCSSKSHCVHEAIFLKFTDEYPEIIEDHEAYYNEEKSVLNVDTEKMLEQVSSTKLNSFIKREFKNNPKFKYDFIKHFENKSLIDKKAYEKKLRSIINSGKSRGFSLHGFYDLDIMAKPLKKFMRTDIKKLIQAGEYQFASELLNHIMDTLSNEIYYDDQAFYNVIYYYQDYAEILLHEDITQDEKDKIDAKLSRFSFFGFY